MLKVNPKSKVKKQVKTKVMSLKTFEDIYNAAVLHAVKISVREYMRNNVKYNLSGKPFTLMNRDRELGTFVPKQLDEKKKIYTIEDIMKFRFNGPKNLSKNIDKIVYGI